MSISSEHKPIQARVLPTLRPSAGRFCPARIQSNGVGFEPGVPPNTRAKIRSLILTGLYNTRVQKFNQCYAEGALLGQPRHLHTDICNILVLVNEFHIANRVEAVTLGVGGRLNPVSESCLTN